MIEHESESPSGRSRLVVENDGSTMWAYLADHRSEILSDVWLANVDGAASVETSSDRPPRAPTERLVRAHDLSQASAGRRWAARWGDEDGVVVLLNEEPLARMSRHSKLGANRWIAEECGWGHPWDDVDLSESGGSHDHG